MPTNHLRSRLTLVGLTLAVAIMLVSFRGFVLYSGVYDMKLTPPHSSGDSVIEFVTLCIYSACPLIGFAMLNKKRQTNASLVEFCVIMFLILGGLLGIMGVMFGGWMMGINNFFFGGITAIACTLLMGFAGKAIVYAGGKLDNLIQRHAHKEWTWKKSSQ